MPATMDIYCKSSLPFYTGFDSHPARKVRKFMRTTSFIPFLRKTQQILWKGGDTGERFWRKDGAKTVWE